MATCYFFRPQVTRFLQAQGHHARHAPAAPPEPSLGALLVSLLDFYAHRFDPRNMGVAVARNAGEGEYLLRDNESTVRCLTPLTPPSPSHACRYFRLPLFP